MFFILMNCMIGYQRICYSVGKNGNHLVITASLCSLTEKSGIEMIVLLGPWVVANSLSHMHVARGVWPWNNGITYWQNRSNTKEWQMTQKHFFFKSGLLLIWIWSSMNLKYTCSGSRHDLSWTNGLQTNTKFA